MPFIDWNNDGKIDPVDIGISMAMESDDSDGGNETLPPESNRKPAIGCLTTILTFSGVLVIAATVILEFAVIRI